MSTPFFSIITVSFRAEDTIADTINSALAQDFSDFEIIVKDGLSDDNTLANIPADGRIKVYSQKDSGIYDAMNQATALACGEYVIYMNCGDLFASNTVLREVYAALGDERPSMIYGNYERDGAAYKQPSVLTSFYLYRTPLCHQSIFFRRQDMLDSGLYDANYRILGDYDAEQRLFFAGKEDKYVNIAVCKYLGGGVSESKAGIEKKNRERKKILKEHFSGGVRFLYGVRLSMTFPKLRNYIAGDTSPTWMRNLYRKVVNRVNR